MNLSAVSAVVVPTFSFEKAGTKPAGAEGHGLLPPESVYLGLVGREDLYSGNEAVVHGVHINVVHIEPAASSCSNTILNKCWWNDSGAFRR